MRPESVAALMACGLALIGAASGDKTPSVPTPLNHFFVVLPRDAYREIQASTFMTQEFAPYEARTTVRSDETYTGIYFYGRKTYFEFFEPDAQGPAGASGIALGVDGSGQAGAIEALWKASMGDAARASITRKTDTGEAPWFEMVSSSKQAPGFRLWFMEYHPDFLARWFPALTKARGVTRSEVLDRYVAKIGRSADRDQTLLADVMGLTLSLGPLDLGPLVAHLRASGWKVTEGEGGVVRALGPEGVSVVAGPKKGRGGIVEVEFGLSRMVAKSSRRFGDSTTLELEGRRATLRTDVGH